MARTQATAAFLCLTNHFGETCVERYHRCMRAVCQSCGRELEDDSGLLPEEHRPCPNCGSKSRRYEMRLEGKLGTAGNLSGNATASPATVEVVAQIFPPSLVAEVNPGILESLLRQLGDTSRVFTWTELTDSRLLAEVRDEGGNVLGSGVGDDWKDAVIDLSEHLKPPDE